MPTSIRKAPEPVAEITLTDLSSTPKWRVFAGHKRVRPGTSSGSGEALVWSVSPDEWTVLGAEPKDAVDLTHVRAMLRLTGEDSADLMNRICALDFGDGMFPNGAAARTSVAGVATEIVRDDENGRLSYLLVPSSSYKTYLLDVVRDAGREFGLV